MSQEEVTESQETQTQGTDGGETLMYRIKAAYGH